MNSTSNSLASIWDDCPRCAERKRMDERKEALKKKLQGKTENPAQDQSPRTSPEGAIILHEYFSRRVELLPNGSVRKTCPKPDELDAEAAALQIATSIGVKAPGFRDRAERFVTMDFVPGETLEKAWPGLGADDKLAIARDLRGLLDTMRAAEPPRPSSSSQIASCAGGPVTIVRPNAVQPLKGGPFADEQAFNDWATGLLGHRIKLPAVFRDVLERRFKTGHRIVLTHGDLAPRNIIVRDGRLAGLVDWGNACWLPEYLECAIFTWARHLPPDWVDYSEEIFSQTYPEELLHWQAMISYLGDF